MLGPLATAPAGDAGGVQVDTHQRRPGREQPQAAGEARSFIPAVAAPTADFTA